MTNDPKKPQSDVASEVKQVGGSILRSIGRGMFSFFGILATAFGVGAVGGAYTVFAYGWPFSVIFWGGLACVIIVLALYLFLHANSSLW